MYKDTLCTIACLAPNLCFPWAEAHKLVLFNCSHLKQPWLPRKEWCKQDRMKKSNYPDEKDMALLMSRDRKPDSGNWLPLGNHKPPSGSKICWLPLFSPVPVFGGASSFLLWTNSKNSATWRAYLSKYKYEPSECKTKAVIQKNYVTISTRKKIYLYACEDPNMKSHTN